MLQGLVPSKAMTREPLATHWSNTLHSSLSCTDVKLHTTYKALVSGLAYLRGKTCPSHIGLKVSFCMGLNDQMATKWLKPAHNPVEHVCVLA